MASLARSFFQLQRNRHQWFEIMQIFIQLKIGDQTLYQESQITKEFIRNSLGLPVGCPAQEHKFCQFWSLLAKNHWNLAEANLQQRINIERIMHQQPYAAKRSISVCYSWQVLCAHFHNSHCAQSYEVILIATNLEESPLSQSHLYEEFIVRHFQGQINGLMLHSNREHIVQYMLWNWGISSGGH